MRAGVGLVPAPVWFFACLVEAGNHAHDFRQEPACVVADFVERVCDVKKEQRARHRFLALVGGVDVQVALSLCFMDNEFEAAFDGDSASSGRCI